MTNLRTIEAQAKNRVFGMDKRELMDLFPSGRQMNLLLKKILNNSGIEGDIGVFERMSYNVPDRRINFSVEVRSIKVKQQKINGTHVWLTPPRKLTLGCSYFPLGESPSANSGKPLLWVTMNSM